METIWGVSLAFCDRTTKKSGLRFSFTYKMIVLQQSPTAHTFQLHVEQLYKATPLIQF